MEPDDLGLVTLTREEYQSLIDDSKVLNALYAGGVQNWEWFEASMEDMNEGDN